LAKEITISVDARRVQAALDEAVDDRAVEKALGALGRVIKTRIQLGFKQGRSPYGVPWKPLKLRRGQPLVDTGRLRSSITSKVIGREAIIGTNVQYARTHQFGAVILPKSGKYLRVPFRGSAAGESPASFLFLRKATVPARPFMPINPAGQVELPPAMAKSALEAMARALEL